MPTDETTLADRVREAREALLRDVEELARLAAVSVARETKGRVVPKTVRCKVTGDFPALDAYAEAIRAEHDTAWRAAIEGLRMKQPNALNCTARLVIHTAAWNAAIDAARASEPRGRE